MLEQQDVVVEAGGFSDSVAASVWIKLMYLEGLVSLKPLEEFNAALEWSVRVSQEMWGSFRKDDGRRRPPVCVCVLLAMRHLHEGILEHYNGYYRNNVIKI